MVFEKCFCKFEFFGDELKDFVGVVEFVGFVYLV